MKDSKTIISHLIKQPSLKRYEQVCCYAKLLDLLPKSFTSMVKFIYAKEKTLFFVLNHPAAKMEFHYKRNLIKSLLKALRQNDATCASLDYDKIEAFVSNAPHQDELSKRPSSAIFYEEKADGTFTTNCEDKKLQAIFEEIKKQIQENTKCS